MCADQADAGVAELGIRPLNTTRARKKVAIYEPSAGPSGPARYVESLLTNIDPVEFEVCVFCHATGPYQSREGVRLERDDGDPGTGAVATDRDAVAGDKQPASWRGRLKTLVPAAPKLWAGYWREARRLARLFRRYPVDLMHSQAAGCEEATLAARLAGIPRVLGTFHVDPTYDLEHARSGLRHRALEFIGNHSAHRIISVSEEVRRLWLRRTLLPATRVVTIHNGIDTERFRRGMSREEARARLGLPNDGRVLIGGVGRLDDAKGFADLIEAVAQFPDRLKTVGLALAGRGPRQEALQDQAKRLGVTDRVFFLGFCPEVQVVYDALDVLAVPSLCDALPYVVMEGMAHELPVVGSRAGGLPEMVADGETGFLVPSRNPDELGAALIRLCDSRELRAQMGHAGRARVEQHFTEGEMVRRTLALYREMLACRG